MDLESNKQDSSSNLTEHVESISNVSSDASNLERINRWKSAGRDLGKSCDVEKKASANRIKRESKNEGAAIILETERWKMCG